MNANCQIPIRRASAAVAAPVAVAATAAVAATVAVAATAAVAAMAAETMVASEAMAAARVASLQLSLQSYFVQGCLLLAGTIVGH